MDAASLPPPISADVLLAEFAVYGRFYECAIAGVPEQLRDRLEIAPRAWSLADCVQREPDLLVIMMNPGGSRPLAALWDGEGSAELGDGRGSFVAAQPDRTQYQIMQLLLLAQAQGKNWRHARVVNLSDLRTPKSAVFIEKLAAYAQDDRHSMFSPGRKLECVNLFANAGTPVLCAWGLSAHFAPLARLALAAIAQHPILGLSADGVLYRHPLPQRFDLQRQWLADMQLQVGRLK